MDKIEVGEIFVISDENDEDQEVEVLAVMTIEDMEYVAVTFADDLQEDNEDDIDVFFLRVDDDGGLSAIENDAEFERVSSTFDEQMDEEGE
ncbi:uncharacterized protein YrzB (UPF0473 family) [Evansella vedderi]|uniref:Uncharacterized protein YrzB (UPF0473 family) n=1 Tax=Evansella vedderi TaxID=38282 RepID=A0ABT9ZU45_9BACI|nr:DUF1292 domain-containing protein [Evansella vedderi]MDQ0254767.1 uncharacterized protein YrzB (UPF0473 family) [Evansella vedderi]